MSLYLIPGDARSRKLMLLQLASLGAALIATFVFHVSWTALAELRIAWLALVVALVVGFSWFSRRRGREGPRTP